jgi:hypothetical protein
MFNYNEEVEMVDKRTSELTFKQFYPLLKLVQDQLKLIPSDWLYYWSGSIAYAWIYKGALTPAILSLIYYKIKFTLQLF